MSKYIGSPVVSLSTDTVDVTGDITTTDATPEVIIVNDTHEDTDGGREGKVTFKGQQSGGEETTLAQIQASHDGTSDDEKGELIFKTNDGSDGASPTERIRIDSLGHVGVNTSSPDANSFGAGNGILTVASDTGSAKTAMINLVGDGNDTDATRVASLFFNDASATGAGATIAGIEAYRASNHATDPGADLIFNTNIGSTGGYAERMRILGNGVTLVGKSADDNTSSGATFSTGGNAFIRSGAGVASFNRTSSDGTIISIQQAGTTEGTISVSGSTVSYNGGHLARWSQLTDGSKDTSIVKGTVMTNLDKMAVWSHDAVEAQDAVVGDDGNLVSRAVDARDAYTEDNEQLNCMAVSSVEGDSNVAGVFVNWDDDDDEFNDMNVAMTGDMVIRIAKGVTITRGDLLMSAGDGTAKPQGDDIVRSKTIAKVTSTNVSHTYDDESYLVPCVLMAC